MIMSEYPNITSDFNDIPKHINSAGVLLLEIFHNLSGKIMNFL